MTMDEFENDDIDLLQLLRQKRERDQQIAQMAEVSPLGMILAGGLSGIGAAIQGKDGGQAASQTINSMQSTAANRAKLAALQGDSEMRVLSSLANQRAAQKRLQQQQDFQEKMKRDDRDWQERMLPVKSQYELSKLMTSEAIKNKFAEAMARNRGDIQKSLLEMQLGARAQESEQDRIARAQREDEERSFKQKEAEDRRKFEAEQKKAQTDLLRELENLRQKGAKERTLISNAAKAGTGDVRPTEAQKSVDREFGKEYVDFIARGGYADAQKNIQQLREVRNQIAKTDSATGPIIGLMPGFLRSRVAPQSVALQDAVEEVVQRNLRLILGAQFTEKEGARLIARAYNPSLPESENIKRLDRLIKQLESAAQAKAQAASYYEKNGTLIGYKGPVPSLKMFESDGDQQTKVVGGKTYVKVPGGWEAEK